MPVKTFIIVNKISIFLLIIILAGNTYLFSEEPQSPNFIIKGDNFSSGAQIGNSTNFGLTADINPFSDLADSINFRSEIGYNPRIQAFTPYPVSLENLQNYYDRLKITINPSNNPDDTLFAVIVSDDNFTTYKYVQNDGTVSDTLGIEDYRDYSSWGAGDGTFILGLNQNTSYKARIKALNGDFTETGYSSDSDEATTSVPYVRLNVSDSSITLGVLNVNSISQTTTVEVSVDTNAYSGYQVYVNDVGNGVNGGLYSPGGGLILSADMVLTPGVAGYGAQANSLSAVVDPKYDNFGNAVGALDISTAGLFSNLYAVSDESATVVFKATMSPTTIAGDYTDVVYFTITPNI